MNVERLHHVARLVLNDMQETGVAESLVQLRDNLQNMINQPNQGNHQQQVTRIFDQLTAKLESSSLDAEGETIQQVIRELEIDDILGGALANTLTVAFETNAVTPSAILEILKPLTDKATEKKNELQALVGALGALGLGAEELEPGECEVGFLIPREKYEDDLAAITKELRVYSRYAQLFSELTTGKAYPPSVHTISSSDFSFYLGMIPAVGAALAHVVNKVVATYKDVLEIRLKRNELAELMPGEDLSNIDEAANSQMRKAIAEVVAELLAENAGIVRQLGKGRAAEIESGLVDAANGIANRLDRGFGIEVRVEPLEDEGEEDEEEAEGEADDGDAQKREAVARILRLQRKISSFRKIEGPGILALPEKTDDDEAETPSKAKKAKPKAAKK